MTETQIDKWNEKAKSGLLANSSVLKKIVSEMRKAVSTPNQSVDSEYNSASAIGITSSNDKGHLTLDEDKLKKALAADPDCVYQLFASNQDTYYYADTNKKQSYMAEDDYNNTGIANRLYFTTMTDGLKSISSYAGTSADTNDQSSLGTLITNLKAKMATFKTQMDAFEDTLYKRYDSMEVAIQRMMAQFNMISGGN
jgi:flagellar capping protein FliD